MTAIICYSVKEDDLINQRRFQFLSAFYSDNGISFNRSAECSSDSDLSCKSPQISFCFKQHKPKDPLHIFYNRSAASLDAYLAHYREYLVEVAVEKEESEPTGLQVLIDSALLFDLFLIKPLRWNSKLEYSSSSLSPGLYCQYTMARIRGIVSKANESELQAISPNTEQPLQEKKQFQACELQIQEMNKLKEHCLTNPQAFPKLFNQVVHLCHCCTRLMGTFRVKGSPCALARLAFYQRVHLEVQALFTSFGLGSFEARM